jgi:PAS domain S-box-containing protein
MAELQEPLGFSRIQPSGPKANILLVDDNPANLLALQAMLGELGQTLVEVRSGEEAIQRAQSDEFAVVLLDVLMPGTSGFETAKAIRGNARSRHTPIIFVTAGDIDRAQMEEGYTLGAVDFLVKPLLPIVVRAKVRGFVELFQDKQQARREAELLRLLVQGTTEYAIFMLDPEGRVLTWNPGAERLKGYKAEEIIGQHFSRFYPPEAIESHWPQHELAVARTEGRFEDEGWRVRKDGSQFWANVVITALRDEAGNHRGFSKITRDMTERKKAEENARRLIEETTARRATEESARLIQEQREWLRVTLASIGDAVITTDRQGTVTFLNPVAETLTGWTRADAEGQPLETVFEILNERTRQLVENPVAKVLRGGVIVGLGNHTVLIARDGAERPIDDSAAPIRDAVGAMIGVVLIFRDVTEQRRAEWGLRQSEARKGAILETALDCIITMDHAGNVVEFNPAAEKTFGYSRVEVVGRELANFIIPPSLRESHRSGLAHYLATGVGPILGKRLEFSALRSDGTEFPAELAINRIPTEEPPLFTAYLRDVSEQKVAEAKLRESEQRFRQLADAMPQIVWTVGPDGAVDYQNRRWSEFTGLPESLGNDGWAQILHPDDAQAAGERWAASLRSGDLFEMDVRLLDRRRQTYCWHLIRTVSVRDEAGKVARWFGTSTDIHEQKKAEESSRYLAEASAALASVVDYESTLQKVANLAVPYFADWSAVDVMNGDGTLRRLAVAHREADKIRLAHELMQQYPPDPEAPSGIFGVLRTGKPEIVREITEEMLMQGAKDERHLRLVRSLGLKSYICVPLIVSGGPLGVLTFATAESGRTYTDADLALASDLARRAGVAIENVRLYQALREADRRKDEFLATLAHELRNPLAPIRNSLQILKMPRVDAATVERYRDMMERQVHHLVRLVDDLLDVSRVMRGKIELRKERIEVAAVVARAVETVQPLMDSQGHELSVGIPTESLPLDADPVRLAQVVGNLLTNAAKYTEPNGRIWLSAERVGDEAVLRVRDNGIGIALDVLPRVFELFVQVDHASTRSQGGLGIGLTLVKNLCAMHNGSVEARSAGLGKGSEFIVRLPISARGLDQDQDLEIGRQAQPASLSGRRLLIVDDNQDAANSLALLFSLQGHEARVAFSGPAALEIAKDYAPDVVFLDIGMPGMDGYEVARRMRQQPGLERVVLAALTGWGQQEDRRRTAEAGFNHHLVKPPEPTALEAVLAELKRPEVR